MRKQTYQHRNIKVVAPRTGLPFDDYPPKVVFLSPKKIISACMLSILSDPSFP